MNRGLSLALILLAFVLTLVGADTVLLSDAVTQNEAALAALEGEETPTAQELLALRRALEDNRFILSVSVPLSHLYEYEAALAALESAAAIGDRAASEGARAEASVALSQIKRSARFSFEQIL